MFGMTDIYEKYERGLEPLGHGRHADAPACTRTPSEQPEHPSDHRRNDKRMHEHAPAPVSREVARSGPDRYRALTAAAVLLIAAIAVVISYQHVVALAIRYCQPVVAAYLLPMSVDGLLAA
jgi:hypothetical protein